MSEDENKLNPVDELVLNPVDSLVQEMSRILNELEGAQSRIVIDALVCYARTKVGEFAEIARKAYLQDDKNRHRFDVLTTDGEVILGVPPIKEHLEFLNKMMNESKIIPLREIDSNGKIIWENPTSNVFASRFKSVSTPCQESQLKEAEMHKFQELTFGEKVSNPLLKMSISRDEFIKDDKKMNDEYTAEIADALRNEGAETKSSSKKPSKSRRGSKKPRKAK